MGIRTKKVAGCRNGIKQGRNVRQTQRGRGVGRGQWPKDDEKATKGNIKATIPEVRNSPLNPYTDKSHKEFENS